MSVGLALPGHGVRIVDPGLATNLLERHVGEVVIEGPSVAARYFGDDSAPRSEVRTGDMGYLAGGQLYIVGRLKELVIVAGRKYAPSDIERVVGALPGVRAGSVVACSVPGAGTEELCILVGLERNGSGGMGALEPMIRRAVHEHFGLTPERVVAVRAADLPRTSSGKVQRAACRAMLEGHGGGTRLG